MDIRIGGPPPVGPPGSKGRAAQGQVEAKVLAVRSPRRRAGAPPPEVGERRQGGSDRDPPSGRVLVLLIPAGHEIPPDLEKGGWRVFLRFARK